MVTDPLTERTIIREIMKAHLYYGNVVEGNAGEAAARSARFIRINEDLINKSKIAENKSENNVVNTEGDIYYVVSWKWWFLWKYYIN